MWAIRSGVLSNRDDVGCAPTCQCPRSHLARNLRNWTGNIRMSLRVMRPVRLSPCGGVHAMIHEDSAHHGVRRIEQSVTILRTPMELYDYWRHVSRVPTFMKNVVSVEEHGARSHWVAQVGSGIVSWDLELTDNVTGRLLAWKAVGQVEGSHFCEVWFSRAPGSRHRDARDPVLESNAVNTRCGSRIHHWRRSGTAVDRRSAAVQTVGRSGRYYDWKRHGCTGADGRTPRTMGATNRCPSDLRARSGTVTHRPRPPIVCRFTKTFGNW
jgi:hypothetical protein